MSLVSTSELVLRAKAQADMQDNYITPAVWEYWMTVEARKLDVFIARSGWPLNIKHETLIVDGSVTDGNYDPFPFLNTQNGPQCPLAVMAVHEVSSQGVRKLKYDDAISFFRQTVGAVASGLSIAYTAAPPAKGHAKEYRIVWDGGSLPQINFYPEPEIGQYYQTMYIAGTPKLTLSGSLPDDGTTNVVNYPQSWEERIVLGMAKRALIREESDITGVDKLIGEINQEIEEHCHSRQIAETPHIRNIDYEERGWTDKLTWPRAPAAWWWS